MCTKCGKDEGVRQFGDVTRCGNCGEICNEDASPSGNDGSHVRIIFWFKPEGDESLSPKAGQKMVYHSEFHGDHSENWICLYENGKEIARYNAAHVSSIMWEKAGLTVCWQCNYRYDIDLTKCPRCDAKNANVDQEGAEKEAMP